MQRAALMLILGASLSLGGAPVMAHHGTLVSYDRDQQWTREAVVTRFNYANPHPQLFFDLGSGDSVEHWAGELLPNPAGLIRNGWTKSRSLEALKPGAKVNLTIAPAKAGGPVGLVLKITDLDGNELVTDGTGGGPPPAAPAARP